MTQIGIFIMDHFFAYSVSRKKTCFAKNVGISLLLPDICGAILSGLNKMPFCFPLERKVCKILLDSWFIDDFKFLVQLRLAKMLTQCSAVECGRPFQINRFSAEFSSTQEWGKITCPHCGTVAWRDNAFIFLTHALSHEQELHFFEEHKEGMAKKCA